MAQPPVEPNAGVTSSTTPGEASSGYAKSRDTRARILAAALEEAGESGFYKTSVARIAARAGVAIGSLNYHFGSRAALILELMRQLMDDYMTRVQAAEAESGGDYFSRERAVLLAYVAHVRRHPSYLRLADEIKLQEPELYRRGTHHWAERMAGRIRAGIEEGTLRPMDEATIRLKAHLLVGARHAREDLAQSELALSDDQVVDAYLELVRDGLGVHERHGVGESHGVHERHGVHEGRCACAGGRADESDPAPEIH